MSRPPQRAEPPGFWSGSQAPAGTAGEVPDAPPPTRAVDPRPRPRLPGHRHRPSQRALATAGGAVTAAAALAAGGLVWAGSGSAAPSASSASSLRATPVAQATRAVPDTRTEAATVPRTTPATSAAPSASTVAVPTDPPPAAGEWATRLARLDAVRSRAFATRHPALLSRVYTDGPLLRADTRTLLATVPAGCRLTGVRTEFRVTGVRQGPHVTTVAATAALQPSLLRCPGRAPRRAAGTAGTPLRVTLAHTPAGLRIVAERRAG